MDEVADIELQALSRQGAMNSVIDRFESPVQQFYCGAAVLVTGGSGFLGKQLIEKLFRSTKLKKLYILIRSKKGMNVTERLNEILQDPVFSALHRDQAGFVDKIIPIEGDVTELELGMSEDNKNTIIEEVNMIFHGAATIRFDDPLILATITNIRGTREILKLAKKCKKLRSFVHVSTAYTHATLKNLGDQVLEQFYPCPVPPDVMIQLVEGIDDERLNRIVPGLTKDWPNTYAFTKALAEELIRTTAGDLPICIIRPTIVICTNCEPVPGWVDQSSIFGAGALALGITTGVIHAFEARPNIKIDFTPMDYVNNACIAAAWETDRRRQGGEGDIKIYVVSSSARNHITEGQVVETLKNEVPDTVVAPGAIYHRFVVQTTKKWLFLVLDFVLHKIPGVLHDTVLRVLGAPRNQTKMFMILRKMPAFLKFYLSNEWMFDDKNTLHLYESLSPNDRAIYHFDVLKIDWLEQITAWCIGQRKYILKYDLKDTAKYVKKQLYLKFIHYIICGLLFYMAVSGLCYLFNMVIFIMGF